MYQVKLLNRARKDLKKIDKRFRDKAIFNLRLLKTDPFLGEKMEGELKGWYKIKIPPIRIVYIIDFINKVIFVKTIGHRGDIYKSL